MLAPETTTAVPPRRRGRPVSAAARAKVLRTAAELLDEVGYRGFSVDEVARRSKVSKSTIYKHWPGGLAIAVEAYGAHVTAAARVEFSGDVLADLVEHVRITAAVYASPSGAVIAQLLGAAASVDGGPELVRRVFFAERRADAEVLIGRGLQSGLWEVAFDPELIVELLFGPIVFRALNGETPLSPDDAAALATTALRGLSRASAA